MPTLKKIDHVLWVEAFYGFAVQSSKKAAGLRSQAPHVRRSVSQMLGCLTTISNKLDHFVSLESTLPGALLTMSQVFPLYAVTLIELLSSKRQTMVWQNFDTSEHVIRADIQTAATAYSYFLRPCDDMDREQASSSAQGRAIIYFTNCLTPVQSAANSSHTTVLPLIVGDSSIFGVLQMSSSIPIDEDALSFFNAFANRVSVAMARDHAMKGRPLHANHDKGTAA